MIIFINNQAFIVTSYISLRTSPIILALGT